MPEATSLLAVYGTLRRGYRNHPLIARGSTHVGTGYLPGRLLHVAGLMRRYPYPGYLPDGPGRVLVEVVRIEDATLWPRLDALERYVPLDPDGSEYVRVRAEAVLHTGEPLTCWTYVYHASPDGWHDVPDGDWATLYAPDVTSP